MDIYLYMENDYNYNYNKMIYRTIQFIAIYMLRIIYKQSILKESKSGQIL